MAIRFIVDSAADILPVEAEEMGICVLPMKVIFGSEEFLDGVTLNHADFYHRLKTSDALPTTCQVPPADWADACEKITANGDTAIIITISSGFSGTYQSACIAAEDFDGKVYVVDSQNVTAGERLLVQRGLELAKQGLSAAQIVSILDEEKLHIRLFALLDTLENLKKGGRISSTTALAGTLLSIKPLISVCDGKINMAGKARGAKQGAKLLWELIEKEGADFTKPFCLAYTGSSNERVLAFAADNAGHFPCAVADLPIASVGSTIGTHAGSDAYAVAFFTK